ncbi:MAG: hypothetical protein QOG36_662, partial [Actinomycetota bacterium]|nr:hypothetical protein [Actinomycetota bacterium]
ETRVDVTRFLAAAAYLDEEFRDEVIFQTLYQTHRFIAPSYGVNISSVVRHCIASRRLSRRRDVMLTALIVVGVWALHLPVVFAVGLFVGGVLVAMGLATPGLKLRWKIMLSIVAYVAFLAFAVHPLSLLAAVLALVVVTADMYERRYRVVARRMNSRDFNPDASAYGRERPSERAADERRTAHLHGQQDGNVIVYGGFSPFVGSGLPLRRWAFPVNLTKPAKPAVRPGADSVPAPAPPGPIETKDAYAHVARSMRNLEAGGWTAADRFCVSGKHVGQDPGLFFYPRGPQDRFPRLRYNIENVAALDAKPPELVRQFADIKVAAWQSELILSTFLRFSRTGDYLFVEANHFVLPPLKGHYYTINTYNRRPTPHEFVRVIVDSAVATPLLWLKAPLRVAKWLARPVTRARRQQRVAQSIRENLRFDYGARAGSSIREIGADNEYAKYFQKMDIERFQKIIDGHLLVSICEFLKGKGVDTTELEQRVQVIMNDGLWVSQINSSLGNVAPWSGPQITGKSERRRPK